MYVKTENGGAPRQELGKDNTTEDLLFGLTFTEVAPTKRVPAVSYVLYFRGNDFEGEGVGNA